MTAEMLDQHYAVNTRSTLLLTKEFADRHDGREGGRGGVFTVPQLDALRGQFPLGRFGEPDDAARLVAFLVSDEARWIVGQVLNSEGGFRRWAT